MEGANNITRCVFAIIFTPILLVSFVWLEEIAKGSELHYLLGNLINHFFVEIMFAAFIPLAIGTLLLLFSRFEEAPRLLRYVLYVITILSLASTLFVAHSLATVPRGSKQSVFWFSPVTFAGHIDRVRNGEYSINAYQTVFTQNYATCSVFVDASGPSGDYGCLHVSLHTAKPVNLSGTLHFQILLYSVTDGYRDSSIGLAYSETSIDLEGASWIGKIGAPTLIWGSQNEHERMRLEGYKVGFRLWSRLDGADYGDVIPFTADVTGSFSVIDFRVDSALQNGVAVLLCGVFVGIYVQMLGKPLIKRVRLLIRRRRGNARG